MDREPIVQGVAHLRIFSLPPEWERCAAFYRDMLELEEIYIDPDAGVAVFECGPDLTLGLERVEDEDDEDWDMAGRFTGISFRVADIARAYATLTARGVLFDGPPEQMEWGGILAHLVDPAGNTLTLVEEPSEDELLGAG